MKNKKTLPRTCLQCGIDFLAWEHSVISFPENENYGRYCSRQCRGKSARKSSELIEIDENTYGLPIYNKSGIVDYALIDKEDGDSVKEYKWRMDPDGYARRNARIGEDISGTIKLHRQLLNLKPKDGLEGDHLDRNRLNCRRSNLRVVEFDYNAQNVSSFKNSSSKYRGVSRHKNKWKAVVVVGGVENRKNIYLGTFEVEEDAAIAARDARLKYFPYTVENTPIGVES